MTVVRFIAFWSGKSSLFNAIFESFSWPASNARHNIIKRAQVGLRPCGCILSGRGLYFGTSTAHRSDESGAATLAPAMHQARPRQWLQDRSSPILRSGLFLGRPTWTHFSYNLDSLDRDNWQNPPITLSRSPTCYVLYLTQRLTNKLSW